MPPRSATTYPNFNLTWARKDLVVRNGRLPVMVPMLTFSLQGLNRKGISRGCREYCKGWLAFLTPRYYASPQ